MQETISVLKQFACKPLYEACCNLLRHFKISFNEVTADPIPFVQFYTGALHTEMPKGLRDVVSKVEATYYIGQIDDDSLLGQGTAKTSEEVESLTRSGKYNGMMVFAVDIPSDKNITRSEMAILTRGFNRTVSAQPVILIIRQGDMLALSTCERMEYSQQWRDGEKLGKVSILRDINCKKPHRGHIDILEELGNEKYSTLDALYKHWMEVFSSELLTKKFYGELSDWYAWAIQVIRFPNDINTDSVDKPMNDMAVIRMITRLIFVWFLYCKRLIPKEFFDIKYIKEHLIQNFAPEGDVPLMYDVNQSRYYRDILQNLFFAMLNRPIVAEGKDIANNRRFMPKQVYHGMNPGYNVNNLMRYKDDFKAGGADEFLKLANSRVPFLNGGLFDCLDDKPHKKYFDGFSENKASLAKLQVPDYLFFGGTDDADLSGWYNDKKKKHVRVEGLIEILHRYYFTIEENTPLDQDVSLDPELLGKVFENLLAAYVPETGSNARKQTGSFYTPREEVQYMVVESLVAHLKRMCGEKNEKIYRALLSYSDEEVVLPDELRRNIMLALYNCRVLDPACGSGAFPMGMLQMMVHVLRRIDPDNKMWHDLMVEQAMNQAKQAFESNDDQERKDRLDDIENAFNRSVNDPDYARKLYIIEHCIYGVDIQPIAIQISKLRFFISLIVDQRPTDDAANNFGIRPLPNLEANFVAANTLIPVDYDSSLVDAVPEVRNYKEELKELNHKVFLAGRNFKKAQLKNKIKETRKALAKAIEDSGFVQPGIASLLASWDMFDQNASASFFDAEWMLGVKGGFDIVIANPPYKIVASDDPLKKIYNSIYKVAHGGKRNLYHLFFERGILLTTPKGALTYISPDTYLSGNETTTLREFFIRNTTIKDIVLFSEKDKVFDNVTQAVAIIVLTKENGNGSFTIKDKDHKFTIEYSKLDKDNKFIFKAENKAISKMKLNNLRFGEVCDGYKGDVNLALKKSFFTLERGKDTLPLVRGIQISRYGYNPGNEFCKLSALNKDQTANNRIVFQEVSNMGLATRVKGTILKNVICGDTCNLLFSKKSNYSNELILGILNSSCVNYFFKFYNQTNHVPIGEVKRIPFPNRIPSSIAQRIQSSVRHILEKKRHNTDIDTSNEEEEINYLVYHLYGLTYDEVLIVDPQTPITREEYEKAFNGIES